MYNEKVAKVVLENTPQNAKYTLHHIQKDILYVLAKRLRNAIREEIGDSKFWIIVDEARVESKKEQMAIVLRFVDKDGFIQERFFDIVHVKDTSVSTLKNEIFAVLSQHRLDIQNIIRIKIYFIILISPLLEQNHGSAIAGYSLKVIEVAHFSQNRERYIA